MMTEEDENRDILRPMSVATIIDESVEVMQSEVSEYASNGLGLSDPYPRLCIAQIILRSLARDYKDRLDEFEQAESELNAIYGTPEERGYAFTNSEGEKRLHNTLNLDKEIGHGMIDERFAYYQGSQPDDVDFSDWGED